MLDSIGVHHLGLGSGVGAFVMERYPRHVQIRLLVFMICYDCKVSLVCSTDILFVACDPRQRRLALPNIGLSEYITV